MSVLNGSNTLPILSIVAIEEHDMNERFKELFEQAYDGKYPTDVFSVHPCEIKRFAELLVKECAHVAVFANDTFIMTAHDAGIAASGRATAAKLIKEHFGVE